MVAVVVMVVLLILWWRLCGRGRTLPKAVSGSDDLRRAESSTLWERGSHGRDEVCTGARRRAGAGGNGRRDAGFSVLPRSLVPYDMSRDALEGGKVHPPPLQGA